MPPVRALLAEVRLAQERASRGEPAHYGELIVRLMRVAFARNAVVEDRLAGERDTSVQELRRLREDVIAAALRSAAPWRRRRLRAELEARFAAARFPFRHDRHVPALIVRGTAGDASLDPTFRSELPWPVELKRALIERGYALTDEALMDRGWIRPEDALWPRAPARTAVVHRDRCGRGRPPSGICAIAIPTRGWRSAPNKKVGRGPGRRSDPMPMKVSRPRNTGALLVASPGGMGAAVRA